MENNQVVLSKAEELFSQTVTARDVNLIFRGEHPRAPAGKCPGALPAEGAARHRGANRPRRAAGGVRPAPAGHHPRPGLVLYDGEQHLARLLQPQEDLRYIFVLPHIHMAQELVLPNVPCLFATVDYNGMEVPDVRF